ncbi:hypothetical protein ACHAWF_000729 [Thalassiosira exigua]
MYNQQRRFGRGGLPRRPGGGGKLLCAAAICIVPAFTTAAITINVSISRRIARVVLRNGGFDKGERLQGIDCGTAPRNLQHCHLPTGCVCSIDCNALACGDRRIVPRQRHEGGIHRIDRSSGDEAQFSR